MLVHYRKQLKCSVIQRVDEKKRDRYSLTTLDTSVL